MLKKYIHNRILKIAVSDIYNVWELNIGLIEKTTAHYAFHISWRIIKNKCWHIHTALDFFPFKKRNYIFPDVCVL